MSQFTFPLVSHLASRDELRPTLNYVAVYDETIYATNGHVMCKVVISRLPYIELVPNLAEALNNKCFHQSELKKVDGKKIVSVDVREDKLVFTVGIKKTREIDVLYRKIDDKRGFGLTPVGGVSQSARVPDHGSVIAHDYNTRESVPVLIGFNPHLASELFKTMVSIHPSMIAGARFNTSSPTRSIFMEPDYCSDSEAFRKAGHALMLMPTSVV